ncbi:Wadjet anti-phage system protein JetD domain-containing protein [Pseudomonas neuropathica]|uniref:Wadjet anti-phage system protein JetD domain-containing protein n=1 Tax=Pseudomonas neuropathica TaxID=2730425 RepID=UPI0034D75B75
MNWEDEYLQVAALKLLLEGELKSTAKSHELIVQLDEIGIIVPSRRQDFFRLVADRTRDFDTYLRNRWPDYQTCACHFRDNKQLSLGVASLRALRRSALGKPEDFYQLNRKTWSAWAGAHSKSREASPPKGLVLTTDGVLRVRANEGLIISSVHGDDFHLGAWQRSISETILPERAFERAWHLSGRDPQLILTVENLGAFVDIKKPDDCLMLYSPGWDDSLAVRFISRLPNTIPWLHFGDLDPNGLRIGNVLFAGGRKPEVWLPRTADKLLASHRLRLVEPWSLSPMDYPILSNATLKALVQANCWLEQEAMVLLPGFHEELQGLCLRFRGND